MGLWKKKKQYYMNSEDFPLRPEDFFFSITEEKVKILAIIRTQTAVQISFSI